jgi:hypothetical protein
MYHIVDELADRRSLYRRILERYDYHLDRINRSDLALTRTAEDFGKKEKMVQRVVDKWQRRKK